MRNWITIVETASSEPLSLWLRGDFYHGTARNNLSFSEMAPAYLTRNKGIALIYAEDDSEVDGGTPHVLRCKLHCVKPYVMDHATMQDLHMTFEHGDFVRDLLAQGYDCAVGDIGADEICVIDPSKIEIVEQIKMRTPEEPSTRGAFGDHNDMNVRFHVD